MALRADRDTNDRYDLHLVRWSAPGIIYKPHANSEGAGVATWAFSPNSRFIAFSGSIAPQARAGLYVTQLPATGTPPDAQQVSDATATVQTDLGWLPGSRVLAYRANVSGKPQLLAATISRDGDASSVPISGPSGTVGSYQLSPSR